MINDISTDSDIAYIFNTDSDRPIFIFKYSSRCGVSAITWSRFSRFSANESGADFWRVTVPEDSRLSEEISKRSGVPHRSPQVILLENGKAVWHASHQDITEENLTSRLKALNAEK